MAKNQKMWTKEEEILLEELWPNSSKKDICNYFDRSYTSIKGKAGLMGLKKLEDFKFENKLKVLTDETNQTFYWLGFLMADGHFSKRYEIKLTLKNTDEDHLKKFMDYIGCGELKTYKKIYLTIAVRDANSVKFLAKKYNINSSKTYLPCDLSSIQDKDLFLSFFTGFFDGDGCVLKTKIKPNGIRIQVHSSWFDNLKWMSIQLNKFYGIEPKVYIDTQGFARFVMFRKEHLKKLFQEIKSLNIYYLERKINLLGTL